jgi:hypothetical protein
MVQHNLSKQLSPDHWVAAISAAMVSNRIECTPGTFQSRLSYRRVVRLIGSVASVVALTAPPGSLKRAAIEAQHRAKRSRTRSWIDFSCSIPFTKIPDLIQKGFDVQKKSFRHGDRRILEHYQVVTNCLLDSLGDPLCDLMLMLVLTLSSSSVTPTVPPGERHFTSGPRKNPASFAAALVTRMLWYLHPEHFSWDHDNEVVLSVSKMTKKMETKGVNNRMLCEMGWVKVLRGNRDTPRNIDIELQDAQKLLAMRNELLSLRKDAAAFIRRVFHCHDSIWLDRCSEILRDEETEQGD